MGGYPSVLVGLVSVCHFKLMNRLTHSPGCVKAPTIWANHSILFSQKHPNDLIRDLCLSKEKAELLASKLKEQNMVEKVVKVSYYRKCNRDFSLAFKVERPFCYWHDIEKFFSNSEYSSHCG